MGRLTETVKVLIIINVLFFVGKMTMPDVADRLFSLYYFENSNFKLWQPITHMFMHAGFSHILFNMFGLFMFGAPLEARWGRNKFLFFYFSAGLGAALIHSLVNYYHVHSGMQQFIASGMTEAEVIQMIQETWRQVHVNLNGEFSVNLPLGTDIETYKSMVTAFNVPALGASGAVYGVLVAFGLMYPNTELMLIFLPIPIKAKYFIPVIILMDLFSGLTGFSLMGEGIAHWAHIGGALFGFIMAYYWKKNSFDNTRLY